MAKHLSQMDLVTGIMKLLDKMGVKDAEPRIVNVCIKAADLIVAEVAREPVMAREGMGLTAWLASDDTGMSSKFMAHVLAGGPGPADHDVRYPIDPADFGRCYRFLQAVPQARPNLDRMRKHGPVWAVYVEKWAEMERLWLEESPTGKCPRLNALMKAVQAEHDKFERTRRL